MKPPLTLAESAHELERTITKIEHVLPKTYQSWILRILKHLRLRQVRGEV